MPDVPGFAESWGTSIVPCPYCDGFEVAGLHWGLVWSSPQSHQSARLSLDWTDKLTVFADDHDIPADIQASPQDAMAGIFAQQSMLAWKHRWRVFSMQLQ